jgi:hypothetical protein
MIDDTKFALGPQTRLVIRSFVWKPVTQIGQFHSDLHQGKVVVQTGILGKLNGGGVLVSTNRGMMRLQDAQVAIQAREK